MVVSFFIKSSFLFLRLNNEAEVNKHYRGGEDYCFFSPLFSILFLGSMMNLTLLNIIAVAIYTNP